MSVRAYRVISEPVLADAPTFNLWSEPEVLDFLDSLESTWNNEAECPSVEVYLSELKPALKTCKLKKHQRDALMADIKAVEAEGSDCIRYESF